MDTAERAKGNGYALAAFILWGLFPLYFHALKAASAGEILAHRIIWTALAVGAVLVFRQRLRWLTSVVSTPRVLLGLAIAAGLIATNWVVYVAAVNDGRTHEAALGYFLNPLATCALGIVVLGERIRRLQVVALGIGFIAAAFMTVVGHGVPWVALALATSFSLYSLTKKRVGAHVPALVSLGVETVVLLPVAALLLWLARPELAFGSTPLLTSLLMLSGVVTAIPLVLFAAAARRVPLVTIGLVQFITPIIQLLLGVVVLREHVSGPQWVGFGIVWVALMVLTVDMFKHRHELRLAGRAAASGA